MISVGRVVVMNIGLRVMGFGGLVISVGRVIG